MPMDNWRKIFDTSDLSFVLKERRSINKYQTVFLSKIWTGLQDQRINRFGLGEEIEKIIEKENTLIALNEDYVVNDNKDQLTFIELLEIEIENMKDKLSNNSIDFLKSKSLLERALNKDYIDLKKVSVAEYYSYYDIITDANSK